MLSFGLFVSIFPFFDVRRDRDVSLLGVVVRIGRRHPGGSGSRDPRGRTATGSERDSASRALTLIVARRDRKYIITVPFNHFLLNF